MVFLALRRTLLSWPKSIASRPELASACPFTRRFFSWLHRLLSRFAAAFAQQRPAEGLSRRSWLSLSAASGVAAAALGTQAATPAVTAADDASWKIEKGRIKQSVVQWCFNPMPLEELAQAAAALGLKSVEIVAPEDWPILKKHGLVLRHDPQSWFVRGFNHVEHHAECIEKSTSAINATADAGFPSVITFSGMRQGLGDEEGMKNTVAGLKKILPLAEKTRREPVHRAAQHPRRCRDERASRLSVRSRRVGR